MKKDVVPGEFYYGAPCARCRTFIHMILDDEQNRGRPVTITRRIIKRTCPFCRHEAHYPPRLLERRQAVSGT